MSLNERKQENLYYNIQLTVVFYSLVKTNWPHRLDVKHLCVTQTVVKLRQCENISQ